MSYEIELPNGQVFGVPDNIPPEEAYEAIKDIVYKQHGVKSKGQMREEAAGRRKADMDERLGKMSNFKKFRAGVGSGLNNVGRQLGNIVGTVSDDEIEQLRQRDAPLRETGAGGFGAIVGEAAPFIAAGGLAGAGMKAAGIGGKSLPLALGMTEGAAQGAVLGGPGNRTSGAAVGAAIGAAGHGIARGGKRLTTGLVKQSDEAKELARTMKWRGQDDFIPLGLASSKKGISGTIGYGYRNTMPMFPIVGKGLERQEEAFLRAFRKTTVKQVYKRFSKEVYEELDKSGDWVKALQAGDDAMRAAGSNQNAVARAELGNLARNASDLGAFTPRQLANENSTQLLRRLAHISDTVTSYKGKEQTIAARHAFYEGSRGIVAGAAVLEAMFSGGMLTAAGAVSKLAASRSVQQFLMGRTAAQQAFIKFVQQGNNKAALEILGRVARSGATAAAVGE
jgi:hypothetical protein